MTESTIPSQDARPLVTFALFAYNQENYIRQAVEGALAQTYEPLEIILSDDCSTDRTFALLNQIVELHGRSRRIILNRNPVNLGLGRHISRVASMASGELIIVAAGDDISEPTRAEVLAQAFYNCPRRLGALHSAFREIDEAGEMISPQPQARSPRDTTARAFAQLNEFITGATAAYDRRVFDDFSPLLPSTVHEDVVLPFRALLLGLEIGLVNESLVRYRSDVGISSHYRGPRRLNEQLTSRLRCDQLQKLVDLEGRGQPELLAIVLRRYRIYTAEHLIQSFNGWNLRSALRCLSACGPYATARALLKRSYHYIKAAA